MADELSASMLEFFTWGCSAPPDLWRSQRGMA